MRFITPRDLGATVREARISAGMTQAELGTKVGASRFWVAEFERGKAGAELGLALKALRALKLVITIEPEEAALRRAQTARPFVPITAHAVGPVVDLSTIVGRATTPLVVNPPIYVDALTGTSHPKNDRTDDEARPRGARKRKRS